jgi:hypothetical protein
MTTPNNEQDLERALIGLYEMGMIHGEIQEGGVGVLLSQREKGIVIAKIRVSTLIREAKIAELQTLEWASYMGCWTTHDEYARYIHDRIATLTKEGDKE